MTVIEFPKGNYGVEFIGPLEPVYSVSLHGYLVPRLVFRPDENGVDGCLILAT